jgi:hypothetical protein
MLSRDKVLEEKKQAEQIVEALADVVEGKQFFPTLYAFGHVIGLLCLQHKMPLDMIAQSVKEAAELTMVRHKGTFEDAPLN